jgi:hypothetical protein
MTIPDRMESADTNTRLEPLRSGNKYRELWVWLNSTDAAPLSDEFAKAAVGYIWSGTQRIAKPRYCSRAAVKPIRNMPNDVYRQRSDLKDSRDRVLATV